MILSTFTLFFLSILAVITTHVVANPNGILHELVARQTFGSILQQCEDICNDLLSSSTTPPCSTDIQCLCGKDVVSEVEQCAQCDVLVAGPDAAESLYQDYADACKEAGIAIPSFTASGPGPSSTVPGSGVSETAAGPRPSFTASGPGPSPRATGSITSNSYSNVQLSLAGVVGSAALAFAALALMVAV